ncbi:hypothetical protein E3N88_01450 [Mikania micrantha]|uniref:Uncharacterized protein n=1 Tax=Mikania micrantha TaxID=192012 RepID=A0A5N6Q101_9ASTR|nr:hypothetical protein E3N88_01450 [Mikania micrantha]
MSDIGQNSPPQFNRGSSSIFPYVTLNLSNETLDQPNVDLHQRENYHELQDQIEAQKRRELNPDPDPMPPPPPSSSGGSSISGMPKEPCCQHGLICCRCCQHAAMLPESLKCAACKCHRSFHRREVEGESQSTAWIQKPPPRVTAATMQTPYHQHHHRYIEGHTLEAAYEESRIVIRLGI